MMFSIHIIIINYSNYSIYIHYIINYSNLLEGILQLEIDPFYFIIVISINKMQQFLDKLVSPTLR